MTTESLYVLLDPPAPSTRMGCWSKPLARYSMVVGYSALGSFFLLDPARNEYLALHPLLAGNNAKSYGAFDCATAFENAILKEPAFVDRFLRPDDVRSLQARLGELGHDQVYYPVPFPCLGGSGDLRSFDKGDVWVFVDLLGQSLGIG